MTEVEIWLVIDSEGQAEIAMDEDEALQRFEDQIGGLNARRLVKMLLMVEPPASITVSGALPGDGESFTLVVKPEASQA